MFIKETELLLLYFILIKGHMSKTSSVSDQMQGSSLKWTVLGQSGHDSNWTVRKIQSGRSKERRLFDLNGWNWML